MRHSEIPMSNKDSNTTKINPITIFKKHKDNLLSKNHQEGAPHLVRLVSRLLTASSLCLCSPPLPLSSRFLQLQILLWPWC